MKSARDYYQDIQPLIDNQWYDAAIRAYQQLLQQHPTFCQAHNDLGTLYYKTGDQEKALEHYQKAVACEPDNTGFLKSLAHFYHTELEQVENALEVYKKIIEIDHSDAQSFFIAANLSVVLQNFKDAVAYYQRVLEIEPWHTEALEFLEKIKGRRENSEKLMSADELYRRSQELASADDMQAAVSVLEQLVASHPEFAAAHNDLGVYYQKMGRNDQALEQYRQALELDPHNSTFEKNLAEFYFIVQGDVAAALKIYLELLKRNPEDVEVLLAAGHISRAVGKPEDARVFYGSALNVEPWNLEAGESMEQLEAEQDGQSAAGM